MDKAKLLFIYGTRPEAIKLCPLVEQVSADGRFLPQVCVTGQHRLMLDQVLEVFRVLPDHDLSVMTHGQSLFQVSAAIISGLDSVMARVRPDVVLVQGDTTSTFIGALAGYYSKVPVAHIEAGLRTWDNYSPFPEEGNRVLVSKITDWHFAATPWAADNLRSEGINEENIYVTGNTGIDAVLSVASKLDSGTLRHVFNFDGLGRRRFILVTAHRRESFGKGMRNIADAIAEISSRREVDILFPVHPNPSVQQVVQSRLSGLPNIHLVPPLSYVPFIDALRRCHFVLTDSGGVQEEAPSLGKPVLVMREKTERPEAVTAGTARLVGNSKETIVRECLRLLDDPAAYASMARAHNPYGDGQACKRIADILAEKLSARRSMAKLSGTVEH